MGKKLRLIRSEPLLLVALPGSIVPLLLIFILRPFIKIRIGFLRSDRIGHFAANTELYLCEKDNNNDSHWTVDLFYFPRKPCNQQLARMWKRKLIVLPWFFLRPLDLIIRSFSCLSSFHAFEARGGDRDIDNLFSKIPPHLQFTAEEEVRGEDGLRTMGIPIGESFVCLTVRDSAYLNYISPGADYEYHNYRDSDVQNFVFAAEELAEKGFFVIRMGAKVNSNINSTHPKVIDYATNGMRNDFMDIYLGAKCFFSISTSTGWDAIPFVFRRPIAYVNMVPIGWLFTFSANSIGITKHQFSHQQNSMLSLSQIITQGTGFCLNSSEYKTKGVELIENTPEEICDVVIEMAERLEGNWQAYPDDKALQQRFWEIFPIDAVNNNGVPLHGEILLSYSANFLRNNREWLS